MGKKKVTAPLTYDPGKGRPKEYLAYLNHREMEFLRRFNGEGPYRGPRGLPSFVLGGANISGTAANRSVASASQSSGSRPSSSSPRSGERGSVSPSSGSSRGSNPSSGGGGDSGNRPSGGMMGGTGSGGSVRTSPSSGSSKGSTLSVNKSGPGSTGGYKTPQGQFQAASNKANAYTSTYGKNAGMSLTPKVMQGAGSTLVSGGPGAPSVLVSPGYESYYTDRYGNLVPVGNVLENHLQDNPVAMTGIKTLSGAGPVDYYRAAQSIDFREIPVNEIGQSVYGYMDPRLSYNPSGGIGVWDPKVVVDSVKNKSNNYKLGGFSRPIMSNTGLGYGSAMERGHFQTLAHELQHVGQFSHLLSEDGPPGGYLTRTGELNARTAYDPSSLSATNYGGIENMNRELDYIHAQSQRTKDPQYKATSDVATSGYLGGVPNYSGSLAAGLSSNAARAMVYESQRLNEAGLNTEADRYTRQTQKLQGNNKPMYGKSNMSDYAQLDQKIREAEEARNNSATNAIKSRFGRASSGN